MSLITRALLNLPGTDLKIDPTFCFICRQLAIRPDSLMDIATLGPLGVSNHDLKIRRTTLLSWVPAGKRISAILRSFLIMRWLGLASWPALMVSMDDAQQGTF